MYICDECQNIFEEPIEETTDYGQTLKVSPCCKETYSETEICSECGCYAAKGDLEDNLCMECATDTLIKFNVLLKSNFSKEQIEFLKFNWET